MSASASAGGLRRVGAVALPILLILIWTAAVRLPFYQAMDGDEFYLSVIAGQWRDGNLPYVASFDIKPPGLYFLLMIAQVVFGESYATIKGTEIVAVAVGALALYGMLRSHGTRRSALWVAILYPVFTMTLSGIVAIAMLVQLPFFILAFWAALSATRADQSARRAMVCALFAGLAIGAAGMIKQTAVFEAVAVFVVLCIYAPHGRRVRVALLYGVGAALPALGFAAYFAALGHFGEMLNAVVSLALRRSNNAVTESYGPKLQWYFTGPGILVNAIWTSAALICLWGAALFVPLRYRRIVEAFPGRVLVVALLWLVAAFLGVLAGKVMVNYYVMALIPPLLILAGAMFCHGLDVAPGRQSQAFIASVAVAALSIVYLERSMLFVPDMINWGDYAASKKVAQAIEDAGLQPSDRLLVLNRGLDLYTLTGARPPTPYFHSTHLLGAFNAPSPDPLGETLAANARFVVVADPSVRRNTEQPARIQRAVDYLAAHYRVAAVVNGDRDSFTVYEYAR